MTQIDSSLLLRMVENTIRGPRKPRKKRSRNIPPSVQESLKHQKGWVKRVVAEAQGKPTCRLIDVRDYLDDILDERMSL